MTEEAPLHPLIEPVTDAERASWPREVLVPLEEPFSDARGSILPILDLPMKSCVIIDSHAGTVRANHYHRTDWHFCYVMSGRIEYYHRKVGSTDSPERVVINEGELFFTPPLVEHAMVFPVQTRFLTLGRNPRVQAVYEADLVRVSLIDPARIGA